MRTITIEGMKLSKLCLGGGKMFDMPLEEGKELVNKAVQLGINIFDGHNRYGNCHNILSHFDYIYKMTKISAYKSLDENQYLFEESIKLLNRIDIFWVSDLDNPQLYENGVKLFHHFKTQVSLIGINTESPELAYRFSTEIPECKFFMLPIFLRNFEMNRVAMHFLGIKRKYVFAIKPFNDGILLNKRISVKDCLLKLATINPTITIVGTRNIEHLTEIVTVWRELYG